MDEDYIEGWKRRHYEFSIAMDGREEKLEELYEEIEKDLLVRIPDRRDGGYLGVHVMCTGMMETKSLSGPKAAP